MTIYGTLKSEEIAEQNLKCRKIVNQITNYGVSQRQIWYLIYLLGMELENVEDLKMVTDFVKEYKGNEVFVSVNENLISNGEIK